MTKSSDIDKINDSFLSDKQIQTSKELSKYIYNSRIMYEFNRLHLLFTLNFNYWYNLPLMEKFGKGRYW